jgi:N-acetylmuramoyl-L-alanine amidase
LNKRQSILTLFLFLSAIIHVYADESGKDFILVIDAGHGGTDSGALGKKSKEKDINFAVAKLVGNYISKEFEDVKIVYTRDKDIKIALRERTDIANKVKANLFISIHSNASKNRSVNGAEVYILGLHRTKENLAVAQRENSVILMEDNYKEKYQGYDPNSPESGIIYELMQEKYMQQSLEFAAMVQKELVTTAKRKDRGVNQAGFWILVGASMPAILIELDFISHRESEKFLASKMGQEKMAVAITNAFSKYKKTLDYKKKRNVLLQEKERNRDNDPIEIVYKVQIFASSQKLSQNSKYLKGYEAQFYVENNLYKYTYGESSDWDEISKIRKSLLKDFQDAFIVKFENGVKVPIK